MLSVLYFFIKISHIVGLLFGLLGIGIGFFRGYTNANQTINSYHPISTQLKPFYVNYYNCVVEYTNEISYWLTVFSLIFYLIGFILPTIILIIVIWKILSYLNKFLNN